MLYVERTGEPLQTLCKEIDPDNWNALRSRVQRAQEARKANSEAELARSAAARRNRSDHKATKVTLSRADDVQVEEIVASLPAKVVERIVEKGTERLIENARAVSVPSEGPAYAGRAQSEC